MSSQEKRSRPVLLWILIAAVLLAAFWLYFGETLFTRESSLLGATCQPAEKIPPEENAWPEYEKALLAMQKDEWEKGPFREWWVPPGKEKSRFTAEEKTFLDRFRGAFSALEAGASKPGCQYLEEERSSAVAPVPAQLRMLDRLISLQCRRLFLEGRFRECAELSVAMYRFGADLFDPRSGDVHAIASICCLETAWCSLQDLLNNEASGTSCAKMIFRGVHDANLRMPTAFQFVEARYRWHDCTIEDIVLHGRGDRWGIYFPDTISQARRLSPRARKIVVDAVVRAHRDALAAQEKNLKSWDFEAYNALSVTHTGRVPHSKLILMSPFLPSAKTRACSFLFTANPDSLELHHHFFSQNTPVMELYLIKADGVALEAMAAVVAYKAAHGEYPGSLEDAFRQFTLPVPGDPATGTAVKYRLEGGRPVIWLPGLDRKDDGGKEPYRHNATIILEGTDLIYRHGETPPYRK
ncbi:MAG: hypothetical protein RDV48_24125 [Candidatus Eremiobacteraeota bacterium]|nr:hypothetical protein [Candidatus Eremiobacteraeota bacterium]